MVPDSGLAAITDWAGTRAMYEGVVAMGVRMAGPLDEERILFDEDGLAIDCVLSAIYPGVFLTKHREPVDADGVYLVRWANVNSISFEEKGVMMGEEEMNEATIDQKRVGWEKRGKARE